MIDRVTKRIAELKALRRLPMHDEQISRLPHIELTSTVRVDKYILKDKVVVINTNQEFGFSLATVHIKSLQAKRVLYSHNSEETFPLQELVDKNYVQGFLLFINGYFIPWRYINLVCLTEKNYLIIHVDKNDEIGMNFIKNNRANSLKVDIVTIPNSYKYKELDETISGTPGIDFIMGFSESLMYSKTDVKYILYCLDDEVEHSYNANIISHNSNSTSSTVLSNDIGKYYDEECCFVFNNGLLDTSVDIKYVGNILNITGKGKLSYVACHSKRYENCINHASQLNQSFLKSQNAVFNSNNTFKNIISNKFNFSLNRKQSYFKNIQNAVADIMGYDSRILMDYACNKTCSVKTFEFTGKQIIDASGPDNIFRISKFYDVALDDKVIVIKNGMLYGLKTKDYRNEDISLSIDRWRIISLKSLDNNAYDEWLSTNGTKTVDTQVQDEWLNINSTNSLNMDITDEWNALVNIDKIVGSDEDYPTDNWYEISDNSSSGDSDTDNWYEVQKVITVAFLEPDKFERDIENSHTFKIPVIEVEETDIVEFLIFQHTNNLIHDTIFNEDDDFDYLSEDVYNLSTNIFCRETNDDYFEFPDNGVQHFPVSYRIEHDETDPYKRRIRYDDEFYYGKEVVLSNKRRFVHKRHIISAEDASGICFDFGTKFMYCNEYANYILFFNGRRLNKNQYRLVLPVRSTTPFFWFYVYLGVFFAEGDVLDIYYTPTPMRDVYITQIESDGIVEVPKENLNYPLNLDSYIFWANGYKVPRSKIRIIDSNRLQLTDDMRTTERFTITEIVDERPESWIIDDFQTIDSEWDKLMKCIDIDLVRSLLNISDSAQSNVVIDPADLSTQTLMHELILKWYYKSTYVDTTKPFIYDYQDPDTDLDAIKEFDSDNNAVLIALDGSKTNRSEKAEQTHRYLP